MGKIPRDCFEDELVPMLEESLTKRTHTTLSLLVRRTGNI